MNEAASIIARAVNRAVDAKVAASRRRAQPTEARVAGVDSQGITWVVLPDGERLPMSAASAGWNVGDLMTVETRGGRAYLTGNLSDPPTPGSAVLAADEKAEGAIEESQEAAALAQRAEDDAERAKVAADDAQDSADNAAESALSALQSAITALYQLSVVEDVAGTIDWLASHAVYEPTADTTPTTGKTYYALQDGSYVPQTLADDTYTPTSDATPQEETDYYTLADGTYSLADVSGGFASGVTYYEHSDTNPAGLGLYEVHASESVQAYVMSHLALTDNGLYLFADDESYRLLLSANGWQILGVDGQPVTATTVDASGHVVQTLGRLDGLHQTLTESRMAFTTAEGAEAGWIEMDEAGASSFHIGVAVVETELWLGDWKWYSDAGGNLALKWMGA